ncbi:hypothetical protein VTK73DRAFT_1823 [Phialemonium thermophilum]|uniref:Uncharacterized protein n=1 Tax=Phialemonium thermophilum TaxID=223376 RepID=A0ABR3VSW6_9PEZI
MAFLSGGGSSAGDREEDGDVWYLVKEMAHWIDQDQDQDTTTVWMPDFETLQNLSHAPADKVRAASQNKGPGQRSANRPHDAESLPTILPD